MEGAYFIADTGRREWRVHIANSVGAEDRLAFQVAADAYARRRLEAARQFLKELRRESGSLPSGCGTRDPRAAHLHRDILQAFDGASVAASQREIAVALYGPHRVADQWEPDGHLRARVRYCLRRGQALVRGGYRKLIYQ